MFGTMQSTTRSAIFGALLCTSYLTGHASAAETNASASSGSPWTNTIASDAKQHDVWYDNYTFRDGEKLDRVRIHYATLGQPHRSAKGDIDNAVLLLHWTGASGTALLTPTYAKALYDQGRPLDTKRYYLIFVDSVGHGWSSKPSDGMKTKFPHYGYGDIVELQHRLITETLGVKRLHAILGVSMGGMNAWQWAEAYPDDVQGVMPVVSLPIKISGRNLLWRRMAMNYIQSDPQWNDGNYDKPTEGWFRAYGLLRTMIDGVPHLQKIIPNGDSADHFIAEARKEAESADATDVLYSLQSSSDYDPEPKLRDIKAKVFALNFDDDEFNPEVLHVLEHLMPVVKHGKFVVQPGNSESFGHLTMAHPDLWERHVADFLKWLGDDKQSFASTSKG